MSSNNSSIVSTESEVEMITVIDCVRFDENQAKNYKEVPIDQAFPLNYVITSTSRYEILRNQWRKVYFDVDGVPDTPENQDLPVRFVKGWCKWIANFTHRPELENMKYVITMNHDSVNHNGLSAHIVCWEYAMVATEIKNSVIMFCNTTDEGAEFKDYVDLVVYSQLRLFKLPNYVGIPIDNKKNYHKIDPNDTNIEHYVIQSTKNCKNIDTRIKVPRKVRKEVKKQAISPANGVFYAKLVKVMQNIEQVVVEKRTKSYDLKKIEYQVNQLLENPNVSERAKNKLRGYVPIKDDEIPLVEHLVNMVLGITGITITIPENL